MGWTEIHNAVRAAVVLASGYPAGKVIWKAQNANAPVLDYIALKFNTPRSIGQDYVKSSYDGTRPPGQEIELTTAGFREVSLELECFTSSTTDANDAMAILDAVRTAMILPSVQAAMDAAEVSPFDTSATIAYAPDVPTANFRGRATHSIRCYVPAPLVSEYTTYISTLSGTVTASGGPNGPVEEPYTAVVE